VWVKRKVLVVIYGNSQRIDLVIDPYTQAANGAIRVVVNAYFDAKPRRTESFVAKTVAVTTSK
jgi:hypothetical protein